MLLKISLKIHGSEWRIARCLTYLKLYYWTTEKNWAYMFIGQKTFLLPISTILYLVNLQFQINIVRERYKLKNCYSCKCKLKVTFSSISIEQWKFFHVLYLLQNWKSYVIYNSPIRIYIINYTCSWKIWLSAIMNIQNECPKTFVTILSGESSF